MSTQHPLPNNGCFCGRFDNGVYCEFEWHQQWCRATRRDAGVTGWCRVNKVSSDFAYVGQEIRIHLCRHNPCQARWKGNKYGDYGLPLHVQPVRSFEDPTLLNPAAAVAAPASAATASSVAAVVDPVHDAPPSDTAVAVSDGVCPPAPDVEPPKDEDEALPPEVPVAELTEVLPAPEVPSSTPAVAGSKKHALVAQTRVGVVQVEPRDYNAAHEVGELPPEPHEAPLRKHLAAEPCEPSAMVAATAFLQPSQPLKIPAATHANILGSILKLAREIRRPRGWVGYSFFVLFALLKKCKPHAWEGENRVDLLEVFAPWAKATCVTECAVDAVCCCFQALDHGHAKMVPVSEDHPLHETRHYVAATSIDADEDCEGDSMKAIYHRLGVVIMETVMDGDCAVDCALRMLSLPSTADTRRELRKE